MTHKNLSLSGVKLEESEFVIHETEGRIEKSAVDALLDGHLAACRIRHFLPWEQRQKIIDNFWLSTARKPRYGDGIDGVEGYFLGASHIEKTTLEYFKEVEYFRPAITQLFQGTLNPQAYFIAQLNG
ncbi:hypothetical protein [Xenorhabdus sp. TS4]|uniref:hypothetical protein n=1 Tax=Xenorhabdus sp. TS4 TaxID=1873483 RepID=UPI0021079464|nr:hypothetical protein [Xenorhabdus sp. TS4]MBC8949456.1 hypothetical protein [Xenorhabdus sp. TS4]